MDFIFKHFKIIFGIFLIGIILFWIAMFCLLSSGVKTIQDKGLKSVVENIWEGNGVQE